MQGRLFESGSAIISNSWNFALVLSTMRQKWSRSFHPVPIPDICSCRHSIHLLQFRSQFPRKFILEFTCLTLIYCTSQQLLLLLVQSSRCTGTDGRALCVAGEVRRLRRTAALRVVHQLKARIDGWKSTLKFMPHRQDHQFRGSSNMLH